MDWSVGACPSGGGDAAEVVAPGAAVAGVGAAEENRHAHRESAKGNTRLIKQHGKNAWVVVQLVGCVPFYLFANFNSSPTQTTEWTIARLINY